MECCVSSKIRPSPATARQHRFLWSATDERSMHQRHYGRAELRRKVEHAGFGVQPITLSFRYFFHL